MLILGAGFTIELFYIRNETKNECLYQYCNEYQCDEDDDSQTYFFAAYINHHYEMGTEYFRKTT